jgi:hypothetical protein
MSPIAGAGPRDRDARAQPVAAVPSSLQHLLDLAGQVVLDIRTEGAALEEVAGHPDRAPDEETLRHAPGLLMQVSEQIPDLAFVLVELILEGAKARYGVGRHSPWWLAADIFVEFTKRA